MPRFLPCKRRFPVPVPNAKSRALLLSLALVFFASLGFAQEQTISAVKKLLMQGDYKAAIKEGEAILADQEYSPALDELYYLLGLCYLKDGNYLRASDIFEIILNEFPKSAFVEESRLSLGDAYFLKGDYDKARKHYEEVIRRDKKGRLRAFAYERLGMCAAKTGDLGEASQYRTKAQQVATGVTDVATGGQDMCPVFADYYAVQVGAFSKQRNAEGLRQVLVAKGYETYVDSVDSAGIAVYKVRVGKYRTRDEALKVAETLAGEGYPARVCP